MNTRGKSYSKFGPNRESLSTKMFDHVIGPSLNQNPSSIQLSKKTRKESKQVQPKKIAKVADNEASESCHNDNKSYRIFDESHSKMKRRRYKHKMCEKKQTQPSKCLIKFASQDCDTGKSSIDDQSEGSLELVVEPMQVQTRHSKQAVMSKDTAKLKPKTVYSAPKSAKIRESQNVWLAEIHNPERHEYLNLDSSMEIGRDLTCFSPRECKHPKALNKQTRALPFRERFSPVLIQEPVKHSSGENSTGSEISFDNNTNCTIDSDSREEPVPTVDSGTSKSTKYTYSYVSTYTYGNSSHSSTGGENSQHVQMKKMSKFNSTIKAGKDNIKEIEFPASLSPIYSSPETEKRTTNSNYNIQRKHRKNLHTERAKPHTQKCSTMLINQETSDCPFFGFPLTLTRIDSIDPSANLSELKNERDPEKAESFPIRKESSPTWLKRKSLSSQDIGYDGNNNHSKEETEFVMHESAKSLKAAEEGDHQRKSLCVSKASVQKTVTVRPTDNEGKDASKMCLDDSKKLKYQVSKYNLNQGKEKNQHIVQQPFKFQKGHKPFTEVWKNTNMNEDPVNYQSLATKFCLTDSSDIDCQEPSNHNARYDVKENKQFDSDICCVNRLYMSFHHSKSKEVGELSLTLFDKS